MLTLRITQYAINEPDKHQVRVEFEGDGTRQTATTNFNFKLTAQEREDLRWYLEDFLQYPFDPAPKIAERIEQRMAEIGKELFTALFHSSDDARNLWATLREHLNNTRMEIVTGITEAATMPWELLRDPKTDTAAAMIQRTQELIGIIERYLKAEES